MTVLVGREAPDFTVPAVLGSGEIVDNFNLKEAINGQYGLVFFYPLDFTFVCPSELIALDHAIEEFRKRDVEVIAVSIDSQFTHTMLGVIRQLQKAVLVLLSTHWLQIWRIIFAVAMVLSILKLVLPLEVRF